MHSLVPAAWLACLMWLTAVAAVGDVNDHFINPPRAGPFGTFVDNPSYEAGNVLEMRWEINATLTYMVLWRPADGAYKNILVNYAAKSYAWTIDISDLTPGSSTSTTNDTPLDVYYLYAYASTNNSIGTTSHYFNITGSNSSPSSALASPTTTYLSAVASDSYASDSAAPPASTGSTVPTSSSNSNGNNYGYNTDDSSPRRNALAWGLGFGLGIPLFICLSILACVAINRMDKRHERREAADRWAAAMANGGAGGAGGTGVGQGAATRAPASSVPLSARDMHRVGRAGAGFATFRTIMAKAGRQSGRGAATTPGTAAGYGEARHTHANELEGFAAVREHYAPVAEAEGVREHFAPMQEQAQVQTQQQSAAPAPAVGAPGNAVEKRFDSYG